jgi:hypothetical protein
MVLQPVRMTISRASNAAVFLMLTSWSWDSHIHAAIVASHVCIIAVDAQERCGMAGPAAHAGRWSGRLLRPPETSAA